MAKHKKDRRRFMYTGPRNTSITVCGNELESGAVYSVTDELANYLQDKRDVVEVFHVNQPSKPLKVE